MVAKALFIMCHRDLRFVVMNLDKLDKLDKQGQTCKRSPDVKEQRQFDFLILLLDKLVTRHAYLTTSLSPRTNFTQIKENKDTLSHIEITQIT